MWISTRYPIRQKYLTDVRWACSECVKSILDITVVIYFVFVFRELHQWNRYVHMYLFCHVNQLVKMLNYVVGYSGTLIHYIIQWH